MDARRIEELLWELFDMGEAPEELTLNVKRATSFEDAIVLTRDRGLVLRTNDGGEFQLTIVQSKRGINEPTDEDAYVDDLDDDRRELVESKIEASYEMIGDQRND